MKMELRYSGEEIGTLRRGWTFTDKKGKVHHFPTKKAWEEWGSKRFIPRLMREGYLLPVSKKKRLKKVM
jgi:hypothetical protein